MTEIRTRLCSSKAVYAPGVVRMAQQLFREGDQDRARDILKCWPGIADDVVEKLLMGEAKTEIDAEEALIVVVQRSYECSTDGAG